MNKDQKVVAVYARVSTGRQEQEATIESQLDELKRKIAEDGHILSDEFLFIDDGWTGELLARPELDRMRDLAPTGRFSILYVYDRGRLSRVFYHQELIINELKDLGVEFISLHDINAITPEEQVMQSMQGVFHQYERIKIVERMRRGKLFKARNKIIINGGALYGYDYVKKTEIIPTHWAINKQEAETVEMIFDWFVNKRVGINEIIRKLYKSGIPPRKRKGKYWTKGPVSRILSCETYFNGIAHYNKSESVVSKRRLNNEKYVRVKKNSRRQRPKEEWIPFEVPVLIEDRSLFEKSLQLLDRNKKFAHKNKKFDYLLSGKFYCEHGFPMVGDGVQGSQRYYRSSDKVRKREFRTCDCGGVNVFVIESLWWKHVKNIISDSFYIKQKIKEYIESKSVVNDLLAKDILSTKSKVSNLLDQETRYAQMFAEKVIDMTQLKGLVNQVKDRKMGLIKKLKELENTKPIKSNISDEEITLLYNKTKEVLQSQDFTDKKLVLRDLVSKIEIKKGGLVNTWLHIPVNTQYLEHEPERRDSRIAECGEVNAV